MIAGNVNAGDEDSVGYPAFGRRLRQLRRSVGLRQSALADGLKVDQTTISRWENGVQTPAADIQQAVLSALGSVRVQDTALKRLVMNSTDCVHLVEEASHICLAYSASRARDWKTIQHALLGVSLWQILLKNSKISEFVLAARTGQEVLLRSLSELVLIWSQFRDLFEVPGGCSEDKLVMCATRSTQSEPARTVDAFEVSKCELGVQSCHLVDRIQAETIWL